MAKFGNKLEALIARNGGAKYRFSKEVGIDRVTLYRFINGERLPGKDVLDRICLALRVSPAEENDLRKLYDRAKIGEDVYERRLLVKELINHINSLRLEQSPPFSHKAVRVGGIGDLVKAVSGSYNVNMLVRDVLDDLAYNAQEKRLWTNTPFEYTFLFAHLRQLYFEMNGSIAIEHAVAFARDAGAHRNPNINLETLANILPFVFCEGSGYQPGYYYSDCMNFDSVFMPYYLFTEKRLLMFSPDYKTAMLVNDPDAVNACRAEFQALRTTPLFRNVNTTVEILGVYQNIFVHSKKTEAIGIEAQPCLTSYFTERIMESVILNELPDRAAFMQALANHVNSAKALNMHSFFTIGGLDDFCESGYIMYSPPQIAMPIETADRLFILKSFRDDVAAGKNNSLVINSSEISVSLNTTVQIYTDSLLLITIANESGMKMCIIDEPSIYEVFSDFLKTLYDSEWVYSKQETLEILDKYIGNLEAQPTEDTA